MKTFSSVRSRPSGRSHQLYNQRPSPRSLVQCHIFSHIFNRQPSVELDEDAAGKELLEWIKSIDTSSQQKVVASIAPGQGRGLFATTAIKQGDVVLTVPDQAVVTSRKALELLDNTPIELQNLPTWSILAYYLVQGKRQGIMPAYFNTLPTPSSPIGCVLEWTDEQVDWLKGSYLYDKALEIRKSYKDSIQELDQCLGAGYCQTEEEWRWAFSLLLSRLVRLSKYSTQQEEALIPWADLVNHSCDATCFLEWDPALNAVVLRADGQYKPGDQVYASYGQKISGELLLSYGFYPDSNPHDACLLHVQIQDPEKKRVLVERGLPVQQTFPLRLNALPAGLVRYCAFDAAAVGSNSSSREELCDQLLLLIGDGSGGIQSLSDDGLDTDLLQLGLERALSQCQMQLKVYKSSFDANREELDALETKPSVLRTDVLKLITTEQRILNRTVFILSQQLRNLKKQKK